MIRNTLPADPIGIAQALVDREFRGLSIKVRTLQFVSALRWPEHKWCNPYAIVTLVTIEGELPEKKGQWLAVADLPENMVPNHGLYLLQCEYFLTTGRPLLFTPETPEGIPEGYLAKP